MPSLVLVKSPSKAELKKMTILQVYEEVEKDQKRRKFNFVCEISLFAFFIVMVLLSFFCSFLFTW